MDTPTSAPPGRRPLKSRNTGWARSAARWLGSVGVRPNTVSVMSVVFAAGAGGAFWISGRVGFLPPPFWLVLAAVLIQGRLLCNLLDGMIAIEGGFKTKTGEIYNELPDRVADLLIIGGAGYSVGAPSWQPETAWIVAALAVTTAYVRALGVTAGTSQTFHGPMAKPHRMALLTGAAIAQALALAFMDANAPIILWSLVLMGLGCVITMIRRCRSIFVELESR